MKRSAVISHDQVYRYELKRSWGQSPFACVFIMLNPSTADADQDDATIRRCMGFARRFGMDSIHVVNLFAFRTSFPKMLSHEANRGVDIVGIHNDFHIRAAIEKAGKIICAWGAHRLAGQPGVAGNRAQRVVEMLDRYGKRAGCLGHNLNGAPRHPVRLRNDAPVVDWPVV